VKVPFVDLVAQNRGLRDEILEAWGRILDTARYVSGAEVAAFEEEFREVSGSAHCVAVSTGTDALMLGLRSLGVRPGDRVVLPANTFIATAEAVSNVGAEPLLVDCDPVTRNIDVAAAAGALEQPGVVGVIPVHLYGQPADMDPLLAAAEEVGAWVMEDAAQAHLARYKGRPAGSLGALGAFSFYPGKNLGAPGEGGAVVTDDAEKADLLRMLRDHGQSAKYESRVIGYNSRMMELVAAALRIKLRHLPEWVEGRRRVAALYMEKLAGVDGIEVPIEPDWAWSVYHLFVAHTPQRDRLKERLENAGIGVGLHYPIPIHLQEAYGYLGHRAGDFPNAEANACNGISLPIFPEMTDAQVEYVCGEITAAGGAK
jgi:dTDP-4-amino-4,6-dideoxygalactose transaminase